MKLIISLLALTAIANAGLLSIVTGPKRTVHPNYSYTIETPGFNPRVYEFTTSTGKQCIALFSSSNDSSASSLFCFNPTQRNY